VPARFRDRLGTGFFLTIGEPDQCLALYPAAIWMEFCAKLEAAPVKDPRYRAFVRRLFAFTEELSCDGQGRLVIPPALRAWAGIERDVVSVGALTRVELWAKERNPLAETDEVADFRTELGLY
jgi:MraZ protein